jgi:hypothetical protein
MYSFDLTTRKQVTNSTFVCTDRTVIAKFADALNLGNNLQQSCGGHLWYVYNCSGSVEFCVDCSPQCGTTTCPGATSSNVIKPCQSCSTSAVAYYTVTADYAIQPLYPLITDPLSVTVSKDKLTVSVTMDKQGIAYCAAFVTGTALTSVISVKSQGFNALTFVAGQVKISITGDVAVNSQFFLLTFFQIVGLIPSTSYDVYCYTESFNSYLMPLSDVQDTLTSATTSCCRTLLFSTSYPSIKEYVSGSSESVFVLSLDIAPSATRKVNLQVVVLSLTPQN